MNNVLVIYYKISPVILILILKSHVLILLLIIIIIINAHTSIQYILGPPGGGLVDKY